MSDFTMTRFASTRPGTGRAGFGHLLPVLHTMLRTYLTRKELSRLTQHELADVGLSKEAALTEAGRLPWDIVPEPRRNGTALASRVGRALERARTRRLISRLEPRELRDIGVSQSNAQFEAMKPFWRA